MHEAGIAALIVGALREHEQRGQPARVLVRGGHTDPDSFDVSLRVHLLAADPKLDLGTIEIVHLPVSLTCANCGESFEAEATAAECPTCGGGAWPYYAPEEVELDIGEPDALATSAGDERSACA
jgi:Zn finger protein HypA/HybF involved in hydrogenase expression